MKTNSKGFTLIELLAVIVILAVIALIATPLIMGTINDAKEGSAKNSAYGYVKSVEQTIATQMVKDTTFVPAGTQDVVDKVKGTSVPSMATGGTDVEEVEFGVSYKGTKPTTVNLTITNGTVAAGSTITISGFDFTLDAKGEWISADAEA